MNPAQLLTHFDRIADAPDAVPRLRRFILNLAVRGKLMEQNPQDEPAAELLKRIEVEKLRLLKQGKIRQQHPLPRIGPEEEPFQIPGKWLWVRFGDVIHDSDAGWSPRTESYPRSGDNWGVVKVSAVTWEKFLPGENKQLLPGVTPPAGTEIRQGDFLISRANTSDLVAKCVIVEQEPTKLTLSDKTVRLHIAPECSKKYLYLVNNHADHARSYYGEEASGTSLSMKNVSRPVIYALAIPLPPLAEQHRIVAKVDELMALCDRLEAAQGEREGRRDRLVRATLARLNEPQEAGDAATFQNHARFTLDQLPRLATRPEHVAQLRQTILNLAVRGKLVPQDPADEPAEELLKRLHAQKTTLLKDGVIKRQLTIVPITPGDTPTELPDSWEWVRVGDLLLGDSQNGYSKKPDDAPGGTPILRISAGTIRNDGVVAEEQHKLVSGVTNAQRTQFDLQPGDLLACRFNGNRGFVGRLSLYLGYLGIKLIYPDKLIRLRLLSTFVLPALVRSFAESTIVRKDVETYCATTVGNWGISASNLKDVKIPLPPLAEQHRIVAKVDELMTLCDRLEGQLTSAASESRRLLEAVLHEALAPSVQREADQ